MKALKNHHQLRDFEVIDAWLFRILLNTWHDACRNKQDHIEFIETDYYNNVTPEQEQQRNGVVIRVRKAVAELRIEYREIITLIDLEEFSYKEVAEILQIPIGTVMSRLCRARRQLKESLGEMEKVDLDKSAQEKKDAQIRRIK